MGFDNNTENYELSWKIARKVCDSVSEGDYTILGAYLPENVLEKVADFSGEKLNSFVFRDGKAQLDISVPLLSNVLDNVRDPRRPNHRWCVLAKNIVHIFEISRGSLCGADLSGLDLTECDFSSSALGTMGLNARFDDSIVRFDSFVRYRLPGLKKGENPAFALDVGSAGTMLGYGGRIIRVEADSPLESRIICDISAELGEGWKICKLRFSENGSYIKITATDDLELYDRINSPVSADGGDCRIREWLYDGKNLISCRPEREGGTGVLLRQRGKSLSACLENWELARFTERHCWELDTGDPLRDEHWAHDREYSGDLQYCFSHSKITERATRRSVTYVHAGTFSRFQKGKELCALNPTTAACSFEHVHPDSRLTLQQLELLRLG